MSTNRSDGLRPIGETAKFFGKSIEWVRLHEAAGDFRYEDDDRIEPIRFRNEKGNLGARYYDLNMIENMALSLKKRRVISKYQCERIINVVDAFRKVTP